MLVRRFVLCLHKTFTTLLVFVGDVLPRVLATVDVTVTFLFLFILFISGDRARVYKTLHCVRIACTNNFAGHCCM